MIFVLSQDKFTNPIELMLAFPNISPEIFSITLFGFELSLRWYALSYIAGFIIAISVMKYCVKRHELWLNKAPPIDQDQADSLLTYLIFGVIVGGRLGYVLFYNLDFYWANPFDIVRVWDGGMAFHGGFLGVIFAAILFCIKNNITIWSAADLIAVASPPGLLLGRIANFINGELWGRQTDMPWGIVFPGERAQDCVGISSPCARHPSQLYEAALEGLLLFFVLVVLVKKGGLKRPGLLTGVFSFGYGSSRYIVEFFREPDPQFLSALNPNGYVIRIDFLGMTMGQVLCLPMLIVGLFLIFSAALKSKENKL